MAVNMVAGKTRYGKEIVISSLPRGLYDIRLGSGGRMPKQLQGKFNSLEAAQISVDSYLVTASYITKEAVEDKNARKKSGKTGG